MARQFVKHQIGLVWNEESRRYIDDEPEFYIPSVLRGRPVNAKQGSSDDLVSSDLFTQMIITESKNCLDLYERLLEGDVAPEQARMVLPQNTMTNWMWTGSLVAFSRVVKLRTDSHAQKEAQELAELIGDVVSPLYPVSWKALVEN